MWKIVFSITVVALVVFLYVVYPFKDASLYSSLFLVGLIAGGRINSSEKTIKSEDSESNVYLDDDFIRIRNGIWVRVDKIVSVELTSAGTLVVHTASGDSENVDKMYVEDVITATKLKRPS